MQGLSIINMFTLIQLLLIFLSLLLMGNILYRTFKFYKIKLRMDSIIKMTYSYKK